MLEISKILNDHFPKDAFDVFELKLEINCLVRYLGLSPSSRRFGGQIGV